MSAGTQQRGRLMYQYKPIAEQHRGFLQAWDGKQLWMSDPAQFNDPLDLQLPIEDRTFCSPYKDDAHFRLVVSTLLNHTPKITSWFFSESLLNSLHEWLSHDSSSNLIQEIKSCIKNYGVSCLTDAATYYSMWSRYANEHQGYAIEYWVDEMVMANGNPPILTHSVEYISTLPTLCLSEVLLAPHQALGRMVATKSSDWAYENEWRIISPSVKGAYMPLPDGMRLSALIAGQKMTGNDLQLLKQKADEFGVPMKRISVDHKNEMQVVDC